MNNSNINIAELRGIIKLCSEATIGLSDLTEEIHQRILSPSFIPKNPISNTASKITSTIYKGIKLSTKIASASIDNSLGFINQHIGITPSFNDKNDYLSILNGIIGDHLQKTDNSLAIPMHLKVSDKLLTLETNELKKIIPNPKNKILLMVHGLCMNDSKWTRENHNHGSKIAEELEYDVVYLNYNSGLHISTNGQKLNNTLESLVALWPVSIKEISIIGHSMGGLVSRSAIHYGQIEKNSWVKRIKNIAFLGTPHLGAPLEKLGNHVNHILDSFMITKPIAKLAKLRSDGIKDLRYGNIVDEDWKKKENSQQKANEKTIVQLPKNINCFSIAANISKENNLKTRLVGDGLVQISSALGQSRNKHNCLNFKENNTAIIYNTNHNELLNNLEVYGKLKDWFNN